MSDTVSVEIRANVAGLTSGLKDAAGAVATSSQQMSASLGEVGKHSNLVGETLRGFKSEAVGAGRTARFFANDLAEIIPGAEGAKNAIRDLLAIGLSGSVIGAAIEGVVFLGKGLKALYEEAEHGREVTKLYGADWRQFGEEGAKHVHDVKVKVDDLLLSMKELRSETLLRHELEEPLKREKELKEDIAKIQKQIADASTESAVTELGVLTQDITLSEGRKAKLEEELKKKRAEIAALKKDVAPLHAVDLRDVAVAESVEEAKRKAQEETERSAINLSSLTANQEITKAREVATAKEALEREIADARRRADQATEDSAINLARITTEQEEALRKQKDTLSAHKELWKDIKPEVAHIATDLAQMALDGKSLDDALKDIATQLLKAGIQFGIQGLFGLGPLAMFEQGGDIPSAATGLDIPASNTGTPILVHGGEAIVTHSTTDRLKNFLNSWESGGGGAGVVNHFHGVWDGESVRRFVNSQDYARAQRDARRMGRLP